MLLDYGWRRHAYSKSISKIGLSINKVEFIAADKALKHVVLKRHTKALWVESDSMVVVSWLTKLAGT